MSYPLFDDKGNVQDSFFNIYVHGGAGHIPGSAHFSKRTADIAISKSRGVSDGVYRINVKVKS